MTFPDPETIHRLVASVFHYDSFAFGDPLKTYVARYEGELLLDSVVAYDRLAEALRPYDLVPLFRIERGRQVILLVRGVHRFVMPKITANLVLFVLTLLSVLLAGAMYTYTGPLPCDTWGSIKTLLLNLWTGWPFALTLLGILLAHEFGHYFAGRLNKTAVTLPYFIPFPISLLGTMGAFIQLKERPRNKRVLLDIGVAGPLAGLVVAIPLLYLGLRLSTTGVVEDTAYLRSMESCEACFTDAPLGGTYTCPSDNLLEGNSLLYLGLKYLATGEWLPAPLSYDTPPLLYWARYLFTSHPIPLGGRDVILHPVAMAAWAGLLVTFLNLIPAGQLDGGHILYALFDRRARFLLPFILGATALMGFVWSGWWLWTALIFLLGRAHAEPLDQITSLDPRRKVVGVVMLIVFLLVLTPVPFIVF